jgi:hypothetical protein
MNTVNTHPSSRLRKKQMSIAFVLAIVTMAIGIILLVVKDDSKLEHNDDPCHSEESSEVSVGPDNYEARTFSPSTKPSFRSTLSPNEPRSSVVPSVPSFIPTQPSNEPSTAPTIFPSAITSISPTQPPSDKPTQSISMVPSFQLFSDDPTTSPSLYTTTQKEDKNQNLHEYLQFYVMGDIPYNRKEEKIFESQLQLVEKSRLAKNDTSIFLVHVGDLMSAFFSKCREHKYKLVSDIFKRSISIPVFTTPGDNEWNKCPDVNAAMNNYTKYFVGMEDHWDTADGHDDVDNAPHHLSHSNLEFETFERSPKRMEN